jgi:uncharacterized membrane protein required for colicin V production
MATFGANVLTGSILAMIGLITVRVIMALFGMVMGFFSFVLSLLPIVLVAWLGYKLLKYLTRDKTTTTSAYE